MALFFKKKKLEEKPKEAAEVRPPQTKVEVKPQPAKPAEVKPLQAKREKVIGEAWKILKTPQVTEKATELAKKNQYVFKVWPRANKVEIKKAIEDIYGVDVVSVKIIKVPRKRRRLGRISGWRKGYKKAIVKIKEGQKIEVLPR